jgi:hypothetical protein
MLNRTSILSSLTGSRQYQALATGPAANSIFNPTFVGRQDASLPPHLAPKYGSLKRKLSTLEAVSSGEPPQKR